MTPRQIELLQNTLSELRRQSVFAAQLFYCRLFTRRPGLRRLFGGAPDFHGTRLLSVMSAAIAGLADPKLGAALRALVARPPIRDTLREADCLHAVGDALQWMLEEHFRGQLPVEVHEAWRTAYQRVAELAAETRLH
jgi:hemoglobin-like flavoprotein